VGLWFLGEVVVAVMKELWRNGVRLAERLASRVVGTEKYG